MTHKSDAKSVSSRRGQTMLHTAFGPEIMAALADPNVTEIMLNEDGMLWCECHDTGMDKMGKTLCRADGERIIRLVASFMGSECHEDQPILSAELPLSGERFEGLLPPIVRAPVFSIRKPANKILAISDYVSCGIIRPEHAVFIAEAVGRRQNIIIVGGTGSGKTTLANALLAEIHDDERLLILEDTRELQCAHVNHIALKTKSSRLAHNQITLRDLVRSTLRLRPDRIIVGEVRGPEALDLLKSWNTGHPGGITTLHAGGARAGLIRLEQLIQEAVSNVPRSLIAEAVDVILFIEGRGADRRVTEIAELAGFDNGNYHLQYLPHPNAKSSADLSQTKSTNAIESQPH